MDEWDKTNNSADQDKTNTSGSDAGGPDSANDIHIENDTHQTPPYTQYTSYQGPYGSNGGYQQNPPYQSPYQYNQAPAGGGKQGGDGSKKKKTFTNRFNCWNVYYIEKKYRFYYSNCNNRISNSLCYK